MIISLGSKSRGLGKYGKREKRRERGQEGREANLIPSRKIEKAAWQRYSSEYLSTAFIIAYWKSLIILNCFLVSVRYKFFERLLKAPAARVTDLELQQEYPAWSSIRNNCVCYRSERSSVFWHVSCLCRGLILMEIFPRTVCNYSKSGKSTPPAKTHTWKIFEIFLI